MKKIGLIAKTNKIQTKKIIRNLIIWLEKKKIKIFIDRETALFVGRKSAYERSEIPALVDLIIVLGGDGTLLSVANLIKNNNIPLLGINLGNLGFLTAITIKEIFPALEEVLKGKYVMEERIMLSSRIFKNDLPVSRQFYALNDVVISRSVARLIETELYFDGQYITLFNADGLIISTPTGSTAYSLAVGGPIVYPTMHALILAPICPHTLTNRPLVVPDNLNIEIKLHREKDDGLITFDGQENVSFKYGETLRINKSKYTTKLIQLPAKNFYQVLREKLSWGGER